MNPHNGTIELGSDAAVEKFFENPPPPGATSATPGLHMQTPPSSLAFYFSPIRPLLERPGVTEVCINRPGEAWIEGASGWERHALDMPYERLKTLADLIANSSKQKLSDQQPILSTALPSGERVQIVIPPATTSGCVSYTIRKPSNKRLALSDYEAQGAFEHVRIDNGEETDVERELKGLLTSGEIKRFLELAVRSHQNIIISGATGSGKTTLVKALCDMIPSDQRLVTIEDSDELQPTQPNHVRLYYSKDGQGLSKATPKQLFESCLRMKPDRILPTEIRSDEAYYFLRSVSSGHPGVITSLHANSPRQALETLTQMLKASPEGSGFSRADLKEMVTMTVDVVLQFSRVDGRRRITGIYYDPDHKRSLSA